MQVNGSIGPSRTVEEGISLGSILSPLLFTIYLDDLLAQFKDAIVRAYADDLLTDRSACYNDMIVASLQPEVDKVVAWSDKAKMTLNTSKYETAFLSLDCAEVA